MKAIDFIKQIKATGQAAKVWFIRIYTYQDGEHGSDDPIDVDNVGTLYFDIEEAKAELREVSGAKKADFGERIEVDLMEANVTLNDIEDVDWEDVEEYGEDAFGDDDLMKIAASVSDIDVRDEVGITYEYESVTGAILVIWYWDRYVGYARGIRDIRRGMYGETTEMCIHEDHTFRNQCSVLVKASELEGLSPQERYDLIEDRLHDGCACGEGEWKWNFKAEAYIESYLKDLQKKTFDSWGDMLIEEKEHLVSVLNETFNFYEYDDAAAAAASVRSDYENNPTEFWSQTIVEDLDTFEDDIRDIIDEKYFNV